MSVTNQKKVYLRNIEYYRNRLCLILEWINSSKPKSILDVGCGEMILKSMLNQRDVRYTGIDQYSPQSDKENFIHEDILAYTVEKKFDIVLCLGVMDHLSSSDKEKLFHKIIQLTDSVLIISIKNYKNLVYRALQKTDKEGKSLYLFLKKTSTKQMSILKFPYFQKCVELKKFPSLFATEYIFYIKK